MNKEIVARLLTFDKKGDGDEVIDENVFLELTQMTKDGLIEIAFTDRNERCYIKFSLPELIARVANLHGEKVE